MINIDEIPKKPGLYKLTCKVNGKVYIGETQNLYNRINQHRRNTENQVVSKAIRKHSWENFEIEIIDTFDTIDNIELLALETAYIEFYDCLAKNEKGYNVCIFSNNCIGIKHSEETKAKLSELNKGQNNSFYGKKHSKETKRKMSEAKIGRFRGKESPHFGKKRPEWLVEKLRKARLGTINPARWRKIIQINKDTNEVIKIWESITAAAKSLGKKESSGIRRCLIGETKTAFGYFWKYY